MSTRDVSTTTFVGHAGSATLTFKIAMSGGSNNSSYEELFDSWLNSYSPRIETLFDFSSSAAAQGFTTDSHTRFLIIIPPTGSSVTYQLASTSTMTNVAVIKANCPLVMGCGGQDLFLKPSGTTAGVWRVLQF